MIRGEALAKSKKKLNDLPAKKKKTHGEFSARGPPDHYPRVFVDINTEKRGTRHTGEIGKM